MYTAPVWGPALGFRTYARAARSLFCLSALMVAGGFRTVSYEAICVISRITPTDIISMELKRIYDGVKISGGTLATEERREERQKSLEDWQIRWDTKAKGR